jgi:hypothetical protein
MTSITKTTMQSYRRRLMMIFDCAHPWDIGMPRGLRGEKRPADVIGGLGPSSDRLALPIRNIG